MNEALILLLVGVIILQLRTNIKLRRLMTRDQLNTKLDEGKAAVDAAAQRVIDHLPGDVDFAAEGQKVQDVIDKANTISP